MGLYFKKPGVYKPKTCKTFCFRMPSAVDNTRRQVNTWSEDEKESARIRDDMIRQALSRIGNVVYEDAYLDKAIEAYFNFKKGLLCESSMKKYKLVMQEFMLFVVRELKHMPKLAEIRRELIERYRANLIDSGQMPKTCNEKRNILTNFFIYAVDNNWIQINPVHKIPKIPDFERHFTPPTSEEINSLLKYLKHEKSNYILNKCYYQIMSVIYYAGLRISEVTHLLKLDIDFNNGQVFFLL